MKKFKTVIVIGSSGLIGKQVVKDLETEYHVYRIDPKENPDFDATCNFRIDRMFSMYNVVGVVNCAYPRNFKDHCKLFMDVNELYSYQFKLKGKGGSIVNLASIYGILGPDKRIYKGTNMQMPPWYAAAKGAIISHSRCISTLYAKENIRINCIAAGGVYDGQDSNFVEAYNNRVPMQRMATTKDISSLVCFLISDKSSYITGQTIPIDGGLSSW